MVGGGLVIKLCPTLETPWSVAHQAPPSMGFPKQEYRSGLPFPPPGDLPDPGIKLTSPSLAGGFFTTEPPGKATYVRLNLMCQSQSPSSPALLFPSVFIHLFSTSVVSVSALQIGSSVPDMLIYDICFIFLTYSV